MKRLFFVLLTLVLALSMFAACSKECETHVDGNGDLLCDVCEASLPCPGHEDVDKNLSCDLCAVSLPCPGHEDADKNLSCDLCAASLPYTGTILSEKVISQAKETKSFKLDFAITISEDSTYWEDYDGEITQKTESTEIIYKFYLTASLDENGGVRALLEYEASQNYEGEEPEIIERMPYLYLIDREIYIYDDELDAYARAELPVDIVMVEETLKKLTDGVEIDKETKDELLSKIGDFALTSFNIFENKGSISIDLKDEVNAVLDCFKNLDPQNDTIEDLLNSLILALGAETTASELTTVIFDTLALTVPEAIDELDATCMEKYGKSLQETYDSVVTNPAFMQLVKNAIGISMENSDVEFDDPDAEIDETYKKYFLDLNFSELAADEQYKDLTLYELVLGLSGASEDAPTLAELEEFVVELLPMTIAEFEDSGMTDPIFSTIKRSVSRITIDALDAKIDINFKGILKLDSVDVELNLGYTIEDESRVDDKLDVSVYKYNIKIKLYDISNNTQSISLSGEKDVYYDIYDQYIGSVSTDDYLYLNCYNESVFLQMYIYYEGKMITVSSSDLGTDVLKSATVTIPGEKLTFSSSELAINYEPNGELCFEVDTARGEYTLISMPEYKIAPSALEALVALGWGDGTDNSDEFDLDPNFGGYIQYINENNQQITISLSSDYYLTTLQANYTVDKKTGNMICTVDYIVCSSEKRLWLLDKSVGFYGGTYEGISEYLGGEETFVIYVDENGIVRNDGLPDAVEEYRKNG